MTSRLIRNGRIALVACALPLLSCGGDPASPDASAAMIDAPMSVMCEEPNPAYCGAANGTIHDGTGTGVLPNVPGDPYPGAPGIWLGNTVSGRYCYAKNNSFIVDQDSDWLDDTCEYELAKAFAPALLMASGEGCGGGEPYWAAKLFINVSPYNWGDFVRLAYLPGYYSDCGTAGHGGDSEFIMIAIQWNPATRHWEVRNAFLSSHEGTPTDQFPVQWHSDWHTRDELRYPATSRLYAFPEVWVAKNKHANYRTEGLCDDGGFMTDTCVDNIPRGRIRVYGTRNVGSPWLDRYPPVPGQPENVGGAHSSNPSNAPLSEVSEYFYTSRAFRGWQHGIVGVTPYASFLYSHNFECFLFAAGNCWYGIPTPSHPSYTTMTGDVDGPASVTTWTNNTWTTFVTGGTRPYHAEWYRQLVGQNPNNPAHWQLVGTSTGPGGSYSAGALTLYQTGCGAFRLFARIFDASNAQSWDTWYVTVTMASCPPPPQMMTWITRDGNWFTMNVYGGPQPYSFSWEWYGHDCGGGGGGPALFDVPAALRAGDVADRPARPRTPSREWPGERRDAVACGWQWFSSDQVVYWSEVNRTLRATATDAQGGQAVQTYFVD